MPPTSDFTSAQLFLRFLFHSNVKKSTLSTLLKLNVAWFYWKSTFIHETNILLDFWTFFNIMCFPFLATLGFTRVVWDQPFCR